MPNFQNAIAARRLCCKIKLIFEKEITMQLQIGQAAPDFTLPSHLEKDVTLSHLRGTNVVLAFFPLAWTPI